MLYDTGLEVYRIVYKSPQKLASALSSQLLSSEFSDGIKLVSLSLQSSEN